MAQKEDFIIVSTLCGKVKGTQKISSENELYYSFKGIPFAKPPVGPLSFRDPEPIEPWDEVKDAIFFKPECAQYDMMSKITKGSDDCLYLNVYTKYLNEVKPKPVMVYVSGGCFMFGSADDVLYGPDYLLTKDIVLVTLNYRVGVFGFLDLEDEEAPGNLGFKDQVMALKWVQANISKFGGDPNNVTIFGGSSGSASVHFLTLSPLTKGLFHKAICQSGCALNPWSKIENPKEKAYKFLSLLNFDERDPKAIVEFLRTVKYDILVEAQKKLLLSEGTYFQLWAQINFPFGPGVDDKSSNPFMPIPVSEAAKQGVQVPFIIGQSNNEGLFILQYLDEINMLDLNSHLENYLSLRILEILKNYNLTLEELKQMYCDQDFSKENFGKYLRIWGDITFVEGIHKTLEIQNNVSGASTYYYIFSYDKNITPFRSPNVTMKGASHGDELPYLFNEAKTYEGLQVKQLQDGTGADVVMKRMIHMWTEFAKHGRPTPVTTDLIPLYWKPINSDENFRYLDIDNELRMETITNIKEYYLMKKKIDINV